MRRKFMVIFLIFSLILTLAACAALQPNEGNINDIEKNDADNTVENKGNTESTNTDNGKQNSVPDDKDDALQEGEEYFKSIIEDRATNVLTAIKNYDMEKLADAVHPDKGVRFSPYAYVDVDKDLVFTAEEVKNLAADTKTYLWGYYDGSGEPINLSFSDYYKRFIYDADFLNAEQVGYNEALGHGNTINNSFDVYENSIIVEYHFSGFDPQYVGMDWRSLRLVFEKKDDAWYLVGIIHDEWTI
ncbi:MAG TPA: hypothetical protein DCE11_03680 [Ruminiclostridium sp.]|nr:hypothetical protein [Clostridiaceae bacterium]HAA25207.1 hypothetical protein [Ruminiclostridium sp.]